ncbi:O-antigen ligase family protein [Rhizobium sp. WYCCWR 11279]|uniref:O-antigen ligase family protein n=1 Tax=Rhizobium changzhiense TaxID=2692317 RepID=UPI001493224C|nr:O-antigen ligase family protein [Rhizobium changzhiense]NNU49929.1 O-antigen ligase family protein [Rhizobium changzhiense]
MSYSPNYVRDGDIGPRPGVRARPRHGIKKETLVRLLLTGIFYLALLRATGMWYGYPSNFDDGASVDPLPQKLMLYSLIPLIGFYGVLEPNRFLAFFRSISPLVGIVIFSIVVSFVGSLDFGASVRGAAAVGLLALAPLLFRLRYGNEETLRLLANFAIFSAFANILYTAAFPRFGIMGGSLAGAVKGLFYHKNTMGQFSAICFIVLISHRLPSPRLRYSGLLKTIAIILTLLLIVVSLSSTAVVMVAIGLATIVGLKMMENIRHSLARAFIVLFLCLLIGVAGSIAYLGVAQAVAEAFGKDLTLSGRSDIWEQVIPLIYDRPIFGYGFATFRQADIVEAYVRLGHTVRSLHNTYLEICLNIGIPGFLCWIAFLLTRIFKKMAAVYRSNQLQTVQAKEVALILLVMIGAMTEAGMMLAPVGLWPVLVSVLPMRTEPVAPRPRRRRSLSKGPAGRRSLRYQHPVLGE